MVVDTHLHLWNPETSETPWRQGWGRFAPRQSFSVDDALAAMDQAGVDRAVLIPTEWDREGSALVGTAARRHPDRFTALGSLSLRNPLASEEVAEFLDENDLIGLRQIFLPAEGQSILGDSALDWLWDALDAAEGVLMVWAPEQERELGQLAARRPTLRIVVDHLNLGMDVSVTTLGETIDRISGLAAHHNLGVKASALTCALSDGVSAPVLARALRTVVDSFGPARVFWGSDLTRTPNGYAGELEFIRTEAGLGAQDADTILGAAFAAWSTPQAHA